MSHALMLEFTGATADDYRAVNAILGLDPETGEGGWPAGMLSHAGAAGDGGTILVFEVWDSPESQGNFRRPSSISARSVNRFTSRGD